MEFECPELLFVQGECQGNDELLRGVQEGLEVGARAREEAVRLERFGGDERVDAVVKASGGVVDGLQKSVSETLRKLCSRQSQKLSDALDAYLGQARDGGCIKAQGSNGELLQAV